ncbi:MAG: heme NO-binding domain-containing protein [Campylobacterales bacterium]|nr:heme NO-binding domain-containing protein [Campylobacterales bacterium]
MRGMVFTELFELIEEKFGYDMLDGVIEASNLENDGAYAATGSYPFEELVTIVTNLSQKTDIPVPQLLEVYGEYLFGRLIKALPQFNNPDISLLKFIESVEDHIHVQVKKLYPDAELPTFEIISSNDDELKFNYVSKKNIPNLAKGLIKGASTHFNQNVEIEFEPTNDGKTLFTVKRI